MRFKDRFCAPVLILALLMGSGCGAADIDQLLLWSDRVVGYTDTTRELLKDLHCEECAQHPISREALLQRLRELQRLHTAHGNYYHILRAGMNAEKTTITLDTAARAKLDSLAPMLRDKVGVVGADLPAREAKRLQPTTRLLTESVKELLKRVGEGKPGKGGVITIALSARQAEEFDKQLTKVGRVGEEIEACLR